jgi:hypothetical protein
MRRTYTTHGEKMNAFRIIVGKSERKRPLERTGRRRENNIKTNRRKIGLGGTDWTHLAQDRDQ